MRRSTRSATPSSSLAPAPARPEHSGAVGLVDHQPRAVALAQLADLARAARCRPPSRRRRPRRRARRRRRPGRAASIFSSLSRRLWRKGRSLARESRQPSRIEAWSAESTITVSPGPSSVPSVPTLAWWPVLNTIASSVSIHSAISLSSSRCSGIVPFSSREPVRPGAVAVQGVLGAAHHPLVAGQAEVVVRAEHDALGPLHLDDRHRRRVEHVEVGQHVGLAGRGAGAAERSWSRTLAKTSIEVCM